VAEADDIPLSEGNTGTKQQSGFAAEPDSRVESSAGVLDWGMYTRVAQEPGRPCYLLGEIGAAVSRNKSDRAHCSRVPLQCRANQGDAPRYRRPKETKRDGTGSRESEHSIVPQ